MKIDLHTEALC